MTGEAEGLARDLLTAEEVQDIRRDERQRCAGLLESHAETIGAFSPDAVKAVRLVALLLSLPYGDAP